MAHIINASTFMSGSGDRVEQATPLIKIDSDGKITAEAVQKEGYVKGGTKTASKQLDTAEGGHITPSEEEQTPAHAGEFLKGDLVVLPIPSEYIVPRGTETITDNGEYDIRTVEKVLVAVDKGVDAPDVPQAVPSITVSDDGLITATAVQDGGLVPSGTKTATEQLDTAAGGNITPSEEEQTPARAGEFLKADLVVLPIPSDYIIPKGTETITENGEYNVRESEKVLVAVNKGVDAPDVPQAVPSITVSDSGLITATAVQEGGLVPSGTKTATKQLTTQEGKTITPTETEQTAVEDNRYTTGAVKVEPIPSEYLVGDEITTQENLIADIEELVAKVGGGTSEPNTDLEDALITHKFEEETYSNDRITSVGYGAFYGASKIKTLDLPNVTSIEGYALYKCTSLTSLNAPLLKSVGSYAIYNVALPVIDFPELETMAPYSFSEITVPCVVRLPKAKTAGNSSFRNSRGITIADFTACTKVDNLAFYFVNNLRALILRKSDAICTLQNTNALSNTRIANGTGYIYVPSALYNTYRSATNWSSFADQFRILENYTVDGTITGEFYEG